MASEESPELGESAGPAIRHGRFPDSPTTFSYNPRKIGILTEIFYPNGVLLALGA